MAYVNVPEDLTKVKSKVVFNLTKRQLICLSIAVITGIPFYFITRDYLGVTNAATGMILLMIPAFMLGMYEKDGLPLEKVLMNMIVVLFIKPKIRRYKTDNVYSDRKGLEGDSKSAPKKRNRSSKKEKGKGGRQAAV